MNILRKIKSFRKAFLTRFTRIHYSQFGEDIILKELLSKKKNGFYVDVGCFHPKKFSNTYALYKKGWRGINIDMEAHKIELFSLARKKDINVLAAISDQHKDFYIKANRPYDVFATLSETKTEGPTIRTKTLNEILAATPYHQKPIDLLTIDAEGHDLHVLRSLDFTIYQPKVLVVESHATDINTVLQSAIHAFMVEQKYRLRSWTLFSLVYLY